MTPKEKAIEEAYGEYWKESKTFINKNGWINSKEWLGGIGNTQIHSKLKGIDLECMSNYDPKYCYYFRPKSLSGIENNNGWISISEELPNDDGFYFVNIENHISIKQFRIIQHKWWQEYITHYQPIQKPKPPIY